MNRRDISRSLRSDGSQGGGSVSRRKTDRVEIVPPPEIDVSVDRLGAVLSARRMELGLQLDDVADDTKIRPVYLRALEEEAFDDLPTPQYARLFLKTYAERLGINVTEVYALLDLCDHPEINKTSTDSMWHGLSASGAMLEQRRPFPLGWLIAGIIVLIVLVLTFIFWPKAPRGQGVIESPTVECQLLVSR